MSTIPAIFAVDSDRLHAAVIPEGSSLPPRESDWVPFTSLTSSIPQTDDREPAVVVDWASIRNMEFDEGVMKNMKVRGRDIWLLTWISDVDDLMDSFNTIADMVMIPLHSVESLNDLRDIREVSDCVIPTIFVESCKAVGIEFEKSEIIEALDFLESEGFYRFCVLDTDGSVDASVWARISDSYPSAIPFVDAPEKASGFRDVISPQHLRAQIR